LCGNDAASSVEADQISCHRTGISAFVQARASDKAHSMFLNTCLPLIGAPVFARACRVRATHIAKEHATESDCGSLIFMTARIAMPQLLGAPGPFADPGQRRQFLAAPNSNSIVWSLSS
jgi:hypothetical protein